MLSHFTKEHCRKTERRQTHKTKFWKRNYAISRTAFISYSSKRISVVNKILQSCAIQQQQNFLWRKYYFH